jgi:hypothetical protein
MQSIKITLREVYGETKAYPACHKALIFAEMLGTKTLTQRALRDIQRLGFEVEVVALTGKLAA